MPNSTRKQPTSTPSIQYTSTIKKKKNLNPTTSISTSKAHNQCPKFIGKIVKKASNELSDNLRVKENKSYETSPKQCHTNLKISAGLIPRARDQPRAITLTNPITKTIHTGPQEVIDIVITHCHKEQQRATPENLPKASWTQPQNPDLFDIQPQPHHTPTYLSEILDTYITRSQYDRGVNKLFLIVAKHSYTSIEWCISATCLLYKPINKNDPRNIANYRLIALMNGILDYGPPS